MVCMLYVEKKIHKTKILSNVLNQNAYMTKPVRLATFPISTVDNLCFMHQNKWNTIKIRLTTIAP